MLVENLTNSRQSRDYNRMTLLASLYLRSDNCDNQSSSPTPPPSDHHHHHLTTPIKPSIQSSFSIEAILGIRPTYEKGFNLNADTLDEKRSSLQCFNQSPEKTPKVSSTTKQDYGCHHHSRSKRIRTIFTPSQLEALEKIFKVQQYMVGSARSALAEQLNLTESQVKVWFQNRRIKYRKQQVEPRKQRTQAHHH